MTDRKPRRREKPAGKVEAKRETRDNDSRVLKIALAMLNLTPSRDNKMFGVTRQTLAKWMRGETSAPREAYVSLLEKVMEAAAQGKANYAAAERAKIEAAELAKLKAEERKRIETANEEHISDALKRMNKNGGTK